MNTDKPPLWSCTNILTSRHFKQFLKSLMSKAPPCLLTKTIWHVHLSPPARSMWYAAHAPICWSLTNTPSVYCHADRGSLRRVSFIIQCFYRLTGWPFDGTHWLISPASGRQAAGWADGLRGSSAEFTSVHCTVCVRHLDEDDASHSQPLASDLHIKNAIMQIITSIKWIF